MSRHISSVKLACADLCNGPFDHRPTCQWGPVDLLVVVTGVGDVVLFHLLTDCITVSQNTQVIISQVSILPELLANQKGGILRDVSGEGMMRMIVQGLISYITTIWCLQTLFGLKKIYWSLESSFKKINKLTCVLNNQLKLAQLVKHVWEISV